MRFASALLAGAAVAALSSSAFAADLIIAPSAPAPIAMDVSSSDWSGFYAGVHGGYGWGELTVDGTTTADVEGWLGGVQAGYNVQMDSILLGVQTDIAITNIGLDEAGTTANLDWLGSTTARLGVVAGDFVPYVKGGVAYGGATFDDGVEDSQTHVGWTVGGGVELAVAENMTVFGEYNYYDLGSQTYDGSDVALTTQVVKAGLNFKF
jgi:opacity protein-like surface antigen